MLNFKCKYVIFISVFKPFKKGKSMSSSMKKTSLSQGQIDARKKGLGGSDIATLIIPDHPFSTPYELWLYKTNKLPEKDLSNNKNVRWGIKLEDCIADEYSEKFGVKLDSPSETIFHKDYPFLLANPDRLLQGTKKGLEIKNVGKNQSYLWGPSGTDLIAEYYIPQVMHYLLVMDYEEWDVAAYFGGDDFRHYHFKRDPDYDQIIIDAASDFWNNYVLTGTEPPPNWDHPYSKHLIKKLYTTVEKTEVELPQSIIKWKDTLIEAKEKVKAYEKVVEGAQAHIMAEMGNASVGKLSDGSAFLRKEVKRKGYAVNDSSYIDFRFKGALGEQL